MHVDIAAIQHLPDFTVDERQDRFLVKPSKLKHTWEPHELHLRSLLLDRDGTVLSAGFPKFFNYGENSYDDAVVDELLGTSTATFTEKLDGSLIIRSIIDGRVHLRTRGNHDLGEMFADVRDFAAATYRDILAPTIGAPESSYLFEYTAPDNQIVLSYRERRLTFLGRIDHATISFFDDICPFSTPSVRTVPLLAQSGRDAHALVMPQERTEGVVAWLRRKDGSIHLSKFKSAWYLRAHALRSFATPERIRDYAWANGFETTQAFIQGLMRDGVDFETAKDKAPLFDAYIAARDTRQRELDAATVRAEPIRALPDRKTKALALQSDPALKPFFSALIYWVSDDDERFDELRQAHALGLSTAQFRNLEATKADASQLVLDLESALRDDG
ncbi:MAG: hypothetical protein EPN91_11315 [Salinibacterium sp.]|nr:MAG: hypothetical protein EPN91_11315 [Salinibacterium sp.]